MSSILNRSAVKKMALAIAKATGRTHTRVSSGFIEGVEAATRTLIAARVHAAKSGKTLQ